MITIKKITRKIKKQIKEKIIDGIKTNAKIKEMKDMTIMKQLDIEEVAISLKISKKNQMNKRENTNKTCKNMKSHKKLWNKLKI